MRPFFVSQIHIETSSTTYLLLKSCLDTVGWTAEAEASCVVCCAVFSCGIGVNVCKPFAVHFIVLFIWKSLQIPLARLSGPPCEFIVMFVLGSETALYSHSECNGSTCWQSKYYVCMGNALATMNAMRSTDSCDTTISQVN